jgi:hypothetical protein
MANDTETAALETMWRREVEAAGTYRLLAERESDVNRRAILNRLADAEDGHARKWAARIEAATGHSPDASAVRASLSWLQRLGDPKVVFLRLEQEENAAESDYQRMSSSSTS